MAAHTISGQAPTTLPGCCLISPTVKAPKSTIQLPENPALPASIAAARADGSGCSLSSVPDFAETGDSCLPLEHRFLTQEQGLLRIYSQNQTQDIEPFTAWNVESDAWG